MAIVSFNQDEIPPISKEDLAIMRARANEGPTEEDLLEIPSMTEEELARMVPWRDRKKQTATV
jgi:hypothetical protein